MDSGVYMSASYARGVTVTFLLLLLPACAHVSAPPTASDRAAFGKIAVYAPSCDGFKFDTPARGALGGLGTGTVTGIGVGLSASVEDRDANGALVLFMLSPLAAIYGGIYGAIASEPAWLVDAYTEAVQQATGQLDPGRMVRDSLLITALERTEYDIAPLDTAPQTEDSQPDYRPLSANGVNTVVEARVLFCGLRAQKNIKPGTDMDPPNTLDPPMQLTMKTRIRVIRTADGREIY